MSDNQDLFDYLKTLTTEHQNPETLEIDSANALQIVQLINAQDRLIAERVSQKTEEIAKAIDIVKNCFENGGRLIYAGSGTSGRLGVLDAAECPPTFGTDPEMVQGLIAGGQKAMFVAQEGAEDNSALAGEDLAALGFNAKDVLCGLAASGRTPYVWGALEHARSLKAKTLLICCVDRKKVRMTVNPDVVIDVNVGPEVIMGSTRMKSGTAQKMVCNMITTGAMIRMGKVFKNVMVDLQLTNAKLVERAKRIIMHFVGCEYSEASSALKAANGHVKTALVMKLLNVSAEKAVELISQADGFVSKALELGSKE